MARFEIRRFEEPDERVTFPHGESRLVTVASLTVAWGVMQPGWHWKEDIGPLAGTEWCQFRHVGICLSGHMAGVMADGSAFEAGPGTFYDIAPGHDGWVEGAEPVVTFEFQDVEGWGKPPEEAERQLTTLLFTDIVGSTSAAERMGDAAWKRLLASHASDVRRLLLNHHGQEVKMTGDGFLATFNTPLRAVRCGIEVASATERLGLGVRVGIHTGEVEVVDGDLRGQAVHAAQRVMALAGAGEVFVSDTTHALVAGSGMAFDDRGLHELKGFSDPRHLYAAIGSPS
ncbi:MAG: adenylate/guanylate cyclase domain-containing protein [Candidatus Limnocylindria bacterium]